MEWLARPRIYVLLTDLADLYREQNSLLREQIEAQTGRPARTPFAKTSTPLPRRPPANLRPYSAKDVSTPSTRRTQGTQAATATAAHPSPPPPAFPEPTG